MSHKTNARAAIYLLIGLVLGLLGQYYFTYRREFYRDGVVFYGVALLMIALALRQSRRRVERATERRAWVWRDYASVVAIVGGSVLSIASGWIAARRVPVGGYAGLFWMWLIGVGWFLLAFVPSLPVDWRPRLLGWLRCHRKELLLLAALLLAAFWLRAVNLRDIPRNLGGDEGTQMADALDLLGPPLGNPFATGWFAVPTMTFMAFGVAMRLFGATVAGARMLAALAGVGAVLFTYLLARELWGRRVAWMAALLLAAGHYHLHFSRLASNQVIDALFVTATLFFLLRGLRLGKYGLLALAGATAGAAWYGYFGGRILLIIVGAYLAWQMLVDRCFWRRHSGQLFVFALAAFVVAVPLLFHYLVFPDAMASRFNQVSIFASGWLDLAREVTGRSMASLLLEQFWKSISAFHYTLDPTLWYHAQIPLLDPVSGVLMLIGLLYVTTRWRWSANGLLLMWFWLSLLLGWVLTENPPSSQRMLVITPAMAILAALGTQSLLLLGRRLVGGSASRWSTVAALVLAVAGLLNLRYYFLDYAPTRTYGNPTAEVADVLCDELERHDELPPLLFDGAPYMYWDFGALRFRLRGVVGHDAAPADWPAAVDPQQGAWIVILAENSGDLEVAQSLFPGGTTEPFFSDSDGRLLFVLYQISAGRVE